MNSKLIGNISEAKILSRLLELQFPVLMPFGDNQRYDIVFEKDSTFYRVQCKTGRIYNGTIKFPTSNSYYHRNKGRRNYINDIDYFGIYCPENNKTYLIKVSEVPNTEGSLRLIKALNNQTAKMLMAIDYEL